MELNLLSVGFKENVIACLFGHFFSKSLCFLEVKVVESSLDKLGKTVTVSSFLLDDNWEGYFHDGTNLLAHYQGYDHVSHKMLELGLNNVEEYISVKSSVGKNISEKVK